VADILPPEARAGGHWRGLFAFLKTHPAASLSVLLKPSYDLNKPAASVNLLSMSFQGEH